MHLSDLAYGNFPYCTDISLRLCSHPRSPVLPGMCSMPPCGLLSAQQLEEGRIIDTTVLYELILLLFCTVTSSCSEMFVHIKGCIYDSAVVPRCLPVHRNWSLSLVSMAPCPPPRVSVTASGILLYLPDFYIITGYLRNPTMSPACMSPVHPLKICHVPHSSVWVRGGGGHPPSACLSVSVAPAKTFRPS